MHGRTFLLIFVFFLAGILSGCGGGGGGASDNSLRIVSQPASVSIYEDEAVELSVRASPDSFSNIYQWYRNDSALTGQRSAVLRIASARLSDAANYHVVVRRGLDTVTSNVAVVTVLEPEVPPYITSQPVSIERAEGDRARFSVTARGLSPLSYQWFKDGAVILGAASAAYQISAADYDDSATYHVEVSNSLGVEVSDDAVLAVVRQRATGLWSGTLGDSSVDVVVPPSGDALMIRFAGASLVSGVYRGQINTREGRWWMDRHEGEAVIFSDDASAYYQLGVNDQVSSVLNPGVALSGVLGLYEEDESDVALSHSIYVGYRQALSQRDTPLDTLAAQWRYLNEFEQAVISISLNEHGVVVGDSYVYPSCAVSGGVEPLEGSSAIYAVTLVYANRSGAVCGLAGLVEKGYALIRNEEEMMLALYLYSEYDGKLSSYFYMPLKQ